MKSDRQHRNQSTEPLSLYLDFSPHRLGYDHTQIEVVAQHERPEGAKASVQVVRTQLQYLEIAR